MHAAWHIAPCELTPNATCGALPPQWRDDAYLTPALDSDPLLFGLDVEDAEFEEDGAGTGVGVAADAHATTGSKHADALAALLEENEGLKLQACLRACAGGTQPMCSCCSCAHVLCADASLVLLPTVSIAASRADGKRQRGASGGGGGGSRRGNCAGSGSAGSCHGRQRARARWLACGP